MVSILTLLVLSFPAEAKRDEALERLQAALCPYRERAARKIFHREAHDGTPVEEAKAVAELLSSYYGKCEGVSRTGPETFSIRLKEASVPLTANFVKGKVGRFEIGEVSYRKDSWEKIKAFASRHLEKTTFWVGVGGEEIAALEPSRPMNVSRSSQVFVLEAAHRKAKAGGLSWSDLVSLDPESKSVSYGLLHGWADGTRLTLDSLRNFVSVESDATASDLLLKAVGRSSVQTGNPYPFLSHREFALLMGAEKAEVKSAGEDGLLRLASELGKEQSVVEFPDERFDLTQEVGWFASARDICRALVAVREDPALKVSARSAGEGERLGEKWKNVVALQARDAGISQATVSFEPSGGGKVFCLAVTVNGEGPVDEVAFGDLTSRIYRLLQAEGGKRPKVSRGSADKTERRPVGRRTPPKAT